MDENEQERLVKAEHSAGFLLDDLREIHRTTDNLALGRTHDRGNRTGGETSPPPEAIRGKR